MAEVVQAVGYPASACPDIIVGRGAEGVEAGALTRAQQRVACVDEAGERTLLEVEGSGEVPTRDAIAIPLLGDLRQAQPARRLGGLRALALVGELLVGLHIAGLSPGLVYLEGEPEGEEVLLLGRGYPQLAGVKAQLGRLARPDGGELLRAAPSDHAVLDEAPA